MATIINNPPTESGSNSSSLIVAVIIIILFVVFLIFGLPYLRGSGTSTQPETVQEVVPQSESDSGIDVNVPDEIDVNVNQGE